MAITKTKTKLGGKEMQTKQTASEAAKEAIRVMIHGGKLR